MLADGDSPDAEGGEEDKACLALSADLTGVPLRASCDMVRTAARKAVYISRLVEVGIMLFRLGGVQGNSIHLFSSVSDCCQQWCRGVQHGGDRSFGLGDRPEPCAVAVVVVAVMWCGGLG